MTYVRHRDRMVQESVFEDLTNTLIALRWIAGTTTRRVVDPYDVAAGRQYVTTLPGQVLKIVATHPLVLIDYFPKADTAGLIGGGEDLDLQSNKTALNTLAVDDGQAGDPELIELGSLMAEIPYRFSFAFWAANVGTAQALMNDLRDRYRGLIVDTDAVTLYDYNVDPDFPVAPMAVEAFSYTRSAEDEVATYEATMFYAQLTITDQVDDPRVSPDAPINLVQIGEGAPSDTQGQYGAEYVDEETGNLYQWSEQP